MKLNSFLETSLKQLVNEKIHVCLQNWSMLKSAEFTLPAFTCSKLIIKTLEQGAKYFQS